MPRRLTLHRIGRHVIHVDDNRKAIVRLPDNSVDAVVTDPPYGLGKEPDARAMLAAWLSAGHYQHKGSGFMGHTWDAFVPQPATWGECFRVLKPGGHLLTFAGTRTHDLVTLGVRLAGFEIRDTIMWCYGSGFPKNLDVSKAIDKAAGAERRVVDTKVTSQPTGNAYAQDAWTKSHRKAHVVNVTAPATDGAKTWQGWGTALKPALEPITVARKPLEGTVVQNVLKHGTGAINIDGCRVAAPGGRPLITGDYKQTENNTYQGRKDGSLQGGSKRGGTTTQGRHPANLIHDGSAEACAGFPDTGKSTGDRTGQRRGYFGKDSDSAWTDDDPGYGDSGSAARFFYCAKVSKAERGKGNTHPTVKPLALMRYLVRLVTPPGGVVLDPYGGSMTTALACECEGFACIAFEENPGYAAIGAERLLRYTQKG